MTAATGYRCRRGLSLGANSCHGSTSKAAETLASQSIVGAVVSARTAKTWALDTPAKSPKALRVIRRFFAKARRLLASNFRRSAGSTSERYWCSGMLDSGILDHRSFWSWHEELRERNLRDCLHGHGGVLGPHWQRVQDGAKVQYAPLEERSEADTTPRPQKRARTSATARLRSIAKNKTKPPSQNRSAAWRAGPAQPKNPNPTVPPKGFGTQGGPFLGEI